MRFHWMKATGALTTSLIDGGFSVRLVWGYSSGKEHKGRFGKVIYLRAVFSHIGSRVFITDRTQKVLWGGHLLRENLHTY